MPKKELSALLAGRSAIPAQGWPGFSLRLLSAAEVLQARREATQLAQDGREQAVCSNACLLSRALERNGSPVFPSGKAALEGLRVEEIGALAAMWADFNRDENPSPEDGEEQLEQLKKASSTRLMNALNGACSNLLAFFQTHLRLKK